MADKAYTVAEIQAKLTGTGFNPGPIDGLMGRQTMNAIRMFQVQHPGLDIDGIAGPKTIKILFGITRAEAEVKASPLTSVPWLDMAVQKKGLNEKTNNAALRTFLKSDGHALGDPAVFPWCGDFVETCVAVTLPKEFLPANPYLARNWMKFGRETKPRFGAIAVFERGTNGIDGHVTFVVGQGPGVLYCLGGNQSNSVSVTPIKTDRLLGCRWPLSIAIPEEIYLPKAKGGIISVNEA